MIRVTTRLANQINELQLTGQATTVMRMRFIIIFALTASAFTFGVWVTPACGQDPAVVNSKTIRVRFENDRVRVLEAILPPGTKEQVHSHPAYVIYVLAGGRYRNYAADGKVTEGTFQTGDVIYRDPLTHAAENIGDKPLHFILVELKGEAAGGTSARP
jgi:quercetin dioxygenase-like cupin family protein